MPRIRRGRASNQPDIGAHVGASPPLNTLIQKGTGPARQVLKARIVLKVDASRGGLCLLPTAAAAASVSAARSLLRCLEELERRDLVKGYDFRKNQYVLLSDEDFDSVKVESSSVMTVETFVDTEFIDPLYYDAAYFLAPDGDAGRDVYAVLREAIAKTDKTALSRMTIRIRDQKPPETHLFACSGSDVRVTAGRSFRSATFRHGIPRSRDNPELRWVYDTEVVGDFVAVGTPVSGHFVVQEVQHCAAEVLEGAVALVVGGMSVHQPP